MALDITLRVGQSRVLVAEPSVGGRAAPADVTWDSTDPAVVAVEEARGGRARVKALAVGAEVVTATAGSASTTATVTVIAADEASSVSLTAGW